MKPHLLSVFQKQNDRTGTQKKDTQITSKRDKMTKVTQTNKNTEMRIETQNTLKEKQEFTKTHKMTQKNKQMSKEETHYNFKTTVKTTLL